MPQIWLQAILHTSITFTQLMIIWICLAFVSLVFGIVFYPWHNLPDKGEITINDIKALPATICEKIPLVKVGKEYPTISQKFRESGSFLTSPMFYIHMVSFAMGNCMTTLTINIANDILRAGSKLYIFSQKIILRKKTTKNLDQATTHLPSSKKIRRPLKFCASLLQLFGDQ